jgi:hypothetical protein
VVEVAAGVELGLGVGEEELEGFEVTIILILDTNYPLITNLSNKLHQIISTHFCCQFDIGFTFIRKLVFGDSFEGGFALADRNGSAIF